MKTLIWTWPVRISHWLLAIGFTVAFILGETESNLSLHFAFGALAGSVALFRIVFGFFGPKYAHFRDFPMSFSSVKEYMETVFKGSKVYQGHNPAASFVMIGILILAVFTALSGYLMNQQEIGQAIVPLSEDFLEETHEILAKLFLILVIFHLIGLALDSVLHASHGTVLSMFTGKKSIQADSSTLNTFQKLFSVLALLIPLLIAFWAYQLPNESTSEGNSEQENHQNASEATKESEKDEKDDD